MKKRLFAAITIMTAIFMNILPIPAAAVSNPLVHLSFESLSDGLVVNERDKSQNFTVVNVSATDGYVGNGISIADSGYIKTEKGEIGGMIDGVNGVTMSAYIKNGTASSGNLFTVYYNGTDAGIEIVKENSQITAYASSGSAEEPLSASYDTAKSFDNWTHITVSIDFKRKMSRFYVDGVHLSTVPMNFINDSFNFYSASKSDLIGDGGIMMDEVKIHPTTIHCSEPGTMYKLDSGYTVKEAYNDVLKDSLISYFPFDEGRGNTVYSQDGFIKTTGHAAVDLDWTEGISGSAVKFHAGDKNWIDIGSGITKALNGANGLTVSGWFYLNQASGSSYVNRVLSLNVTNGALCHFNIRSSKEISFAARSYNESSATGLNFINTKNAEDLKKFEFGEWHHITMTTDLEANTMRLFLDGEEVLPNNSSASSATAYENKHFIINGDAPNATIGGDSSDMSYTKTFNGAMDELKIYNRAVTVNEARYIYHENTNGSVMSRDKDNYAVLNKLSEDMLVMAKGYNEVITKQKRQRIDWENADAVPALVSSTLFVPTNVIEKIAGEETIVDLTAGTMTVRGMVFTAGSTKYTVFGTENTMQAAPYINSGTMYVPLREIAERMGKTVYYNSSGLTVVGTAESIGQVENDNKYCKWLYDALTNLPYEQQSADHYGTRKAVAVSENPSKIYLSSPSMVRLSDGTLVASHDTAGHGTTIYRSEDNGETWQKVRKPDADSDDDSIDDTIEEIVYANLFTNTPSSTGKESLYLMGVRRGTGEAAAVAVYRSDDGGLTWSVPKDNKTGWIVEDDGTSVVMPAHTAPTPVVRKDGRIYRAFDISGSSWKEFKVVVMSADENADLLDRDSWTISNTLKLSDYAATFRNTLNCADPGMCEANAVIGPDGEIYVLARFNSAPSVDWAAVLKLTDDNTLKFDRVVPFPGGMTKFLVRYDEALRKYIAFANPNTQRDYPLQRICLSMLVSEDLYNWEIAETLLVPDWLGNWETLTQENSFQYPDWIFDGDDILYVVRESALGAADYHNSNCITFYRLENYKQYISE